MKEYAFPCAPNWYVHEPVEVVRSQNVEIIYDQFIATDRPIGANRPDILVRDKANMVVYIIDISCPMEANMWNKEVEKVSKYGPLKEKLQRMWNEKRRKTDAKIKRKSHSSPLESGRLPEVK